MTDSLSEVFSRKTWHKKGSRIVFLKSIKNSKRRNKGNFKSKSN